MATKVAKEDKVIFGLVAQSTNDAMRTAMLTNIAELRVVSLESIQAKFKAFDEENVAATAKARRKAALERLNGEAGSMTLQSDNLGDFIARVVKAKGSVTLNPDLSLSVDLPKASGGGTGGGRVSNDHPQPYVDCEGTRVLGPITFWLDANVTEDDQEDIEGAFRPNGKRRSGDTLAKALVKAGILTDSPVPA